MSKYVIPLIEETFPIHAPLQNSLLTLDKGCCESAYLDMVHLYAKLGMGGVLIIDDNGHWNSARCAIEQYMTEKKLRLLANRIDYTGRACGKVDA
jgi:O-methyltransferase